MDRNSVTILGRLTELFFIPRTISSIPRATIMPYQDQDRGEASAVPRAQHLRKHSPQGYVSAGWHLRMEAS